MVIAGEMSLALPAKGSMLSFQSRAASVALMFDWVLRSGSLKLEAHRKMYW